MANSPHGKIEAQSVRDRQAGQIDAHTFKRRAGRRALPRQGSLIAQATVSRWSASASIGKEALASVKQLVVRQDLVDGDSSPLSLLSSPSIPRAIAKFW